MSRSQILLLAFGTIVVMGGLGFYFTPLVRDVNIFVFLTGNYPVYQQIFIGSVTGYTIATIGWQIIKLPYLNSVRTFFSNVIGGIQLNLMQIIFISICAGVGEEFLFRGAIQPLLGIWITSIIFVFIHGYLNPYNRPLFLYGIFMTFSIALLGYLTEKVGIISSMAAHTMVDIILLYHLTLPKE